MVFTVLKAVLRCVAAGVIGAALIGPAFAQMVPLEPILRVAGDNSAGGGHVGQFASFKHDAEAGQHVAYYDVLEGDLKYAHRNNVSRPWTVQVVDSTGDVGKHCALDVGAKQSLLVNVDVLSASDEVVFSSGSLAFEAYAGGTLELTSDGIVREIVSVDAAANSVRLAAPYAGATTTGTQATIRWFQAAIAYQADIGTGSAIKVARPGADGNWIIDILEPFGQVLAGFNSGFYNSVAIDSTGRIAVCWQDRTPVGFQVGKLRYASFTSFWGFEDPDPTFRRGSECRIVIDVNDRPVISYRDDVSRKLHSTVREAPGAWVPRNLEFGSGAFNALSTTYFPAGDKVFTAYQQTPSSSTEVIDVLLAQGDNYLGTNRDWTSQPAATGPAYGAFTSVASGPTTGTTRVVFYDSYRKRLMATENVGFSRTTWSAPFTLDQGVDVGQFCSSSMLPPALNDLYTAYYDANAGALKLSRWDGATTSTSFIDGVKIGEHADIGVTSDSVVVAYHNESEGSLRVARWPRGSSPSDPLFTDVLVDASSSDVGESVRMAIDQYDRIFLLYYDRANTNLRLAAYYNDTWFPRHLNGETTTSQPQVDLGEFCDISVSSDSTTLAMVYYDGTQQQLYWGKAPLAPPTPFLNVLFNVAPAGAGPKTGRFCSMVFDPDGPHIHAACYDETKLRPIYALLGASLSIEPIEDSVFDGSGWYPSIALDPDGQPAVAYYDFSNSELKYAKRNAVNDWDVEVVDALPDTGSYPHLRFDPFSGRSYILYHSAEDNELKLAYKRPDLTYWFSNLTVGSGYAGTRPRFVVDPATGLFTLLFYDNISGDLFATATDALTNVTGANAIWGIYR